MNENKYFIVYIISSVISLVGLHYVDTSIIAKLIAGYPFIDLKDFSLLSMLKVGLNISLLSLTYILIIAQSLILYTISIKTNNIHIKRASNASTILGSLIFIMILGLIIYYKITNSLLILPYNISYYGLILIINCIVFAFFNIVILIESNIKNMIKFLLITGIINILYIAQILLLYISFTNYIIDKGNLASKENSKYTFYSTNYLLGIKQESKITDMKIITDNYTDYTAISLQLAVNNLNNKDIINIMDAYYKNWDKIIKEDSFIEKNILKDITSKYIISKKIYRKYKKQDSKIILIYRERGELEMFKYIDNNKIQTAFTHQLKR